MRDPNRIASMCFRLAAAWQKQPDLRLGQLLFNAEHHVEAEVFYMEDEDLISAIESMLKSDGM